MKTVFFDNCLDINGSQFKVGDKVKLYPGGVETIGTVIFDEGSKVIAGPVGVDEIQIYKGFFVTWENGVHRLGLSSDLEIISARNDELPIFRAIREVENNAKN